MSSSFFNVSPTWLLQPNSLINVISNQYASLKDVSSFVSVPNFTSFSSALKQALYWRRRLSSSASDKTVIFSLLSDKGLILPNVLEVCQALKSICDMSQVTEFYRAMNSSFIGISFSNSTEAVKVRSYFTFFQQSLVIHASPSNSHLHQFKLLWLPPLFADSRIHHFLSRHAVHHQFTRDHISIDNDTNTPLNSVFGTLELAPNCDITKIPHLIPLPSPHLGSALLIISGRPSLCLKCGGSGHIRRSCPAVKCIICKHFHESSSTCPTTSIISGLPSGHPWLEDDLINVSPSTEDTDFTISPPECDRIFDTSSPVHLSVTMDNTSFSSKPFLVHTASPSLDSPTTMATLSTAPHNLNITSDPSNLVIKRTTRSMSSTKHALNTNVSSSVISSNLCASNLFEHLIDEANSISLPISSHDTSASLSMLDPSHQDFVSPSVLPTAAQVSSASFIDMSSLNTAPSSSILPLGSSNLLSSSLSSRLTSDHIHTSLPSPPLTPSSKRVKRSSSILSSDSVLSSDGSPISTIGSWADQVSTELDIADASSTLLPISTVSSSQSSALTLVPHEANKELSIDSSPSSSSDTSLHPASHHLLQTVPLEASYTMSPINDIASDSDEPDNVLIISLTGLPQNTTFQNLKKIVGKPHPYSFYDICGPKGEVLKYLLKYRCSDNIKHVKSLNGKKIGNNIISTSIHFTSSHPS